MKTQPDKTPGETPPGQNPTIKILHQNSHAKPPPLPPPSKPPRQNPPAKLVFCCNIHRL